MTENNGSRMLDLTDHHEHPIWDAMRSQKPGIGRFSQILNEMKDLHDAKRSDYTGDGADILHNYRMAAQTMGISTPLAILGRLQEKVTRLAMILPKEEWRVKDEPPTDTWLDIAIIGVLGLIACEQELEASK